MLDPFDWLSDLNNTKQLARQRKESGVTQANAKQEFAELQQELGL